MQPSVSKFRAASDIDCSDYEELYRSANLFQTWLVGTTLYSVFCRVSQLFFSKVLFLFEIMSPLFSLYVFKTLNLDPSFFLCKLCLVYYVFRDTEKNLLGDDGLETTQTTRQKKKSLLDDDDDAFFVLSAARVVVVVVVVVV